MVGDTGYALEQAVVQPFTTYSCSHCWPYKATHIPRRKWHSIRYRFRASTPLHSHAWSHSCCPRHEFCYRKSSLAIFKECKKALSLPKSCFCRAVMAEKLDDACLRCVIHMILSKSAWIFTHYPRVSLVQKKPSRSSKWDFGIFPQRNWENFGNYFSSVNSTEFAIFWFIFIQNFDIKKMKRKHSSTEEVSSPMN